MNMNPLLDFWSHAYAAYEKPLAHGLGFAVPGWADPLLSPHFVVGNRDSFLAANPNISYFNELSAHEDRAPLGFALRRRFLVGWKTVSVKHPPDGYQLERISLLEALQWPEYTELLRDAFPEDAPFLAALLPFLATLRARYEVIFLRRSGQLYGAVTVGIAGSSALVLNLAVSSVHRRRGLSRILIEAAESAAWQEGALHACYWTELGFLREHATDSVYYSIYSEDV